MKTILIAILVAALAAGCNFSKSVKKDFVSGLTSKGNVLTCNDVYFTINNEKTTRTEFNYGEQVFVIFNDIQGFTRENGNAFPSMDIIVTDDAGDTTFAAKDLYSEYTDGMKFSPLQLTGDLTVAAPIKSGKNYLMTTIIRDRKGPGTYTSTLKFSVRHNDLVKVETNKAAIGEVYLYSQEKDKVINDNKIGFGDNIYIIAEGLKGFSETAGMVYPGLSLKGTDAAGNEVLKYEDLLNEYSATGVAASDFSARVSSHFQLTGEKFNNPLNCEMVVWDKKSDSRIRITVSLNVE